MSSLYSHISVVFLQISLKYLRGFTFVGFSDSYLFDYTFSTISVCCPMICRCFFLLDTVRIVVST